MLVIYDDFIFTRSGRWRRDKGLGKNFKKQKRVGSKVKAGEPGPTKAAGSLIDALFSAFLANAPALFHIFLEYTCHHFFHFVLKFNDYYLFFQNCLQFFFSCY